jgi:hypothetical protein
MNHKQGLKISARRIDKADPTKKLSAHLRRGRYLPRRIAIAADPG